MNTQVREIEPRKGNFPRHGEWDFGGRRFIVPSQSQPGVEYIVEDVLKPCEVDPEMVRAVLKCNCPAGTNGKRCKHLDMVSAFLDAEEDAEDAEEQF